MRRFGSKLALFAMCATTLSACGGRTTQQSASAYSVLTVSTSDITLQTTYSAAVQGRQDVAILPQVSGTITSVKINEGEKVSKGQVLFVIDQVPYIASYNSAKANLEAAQAALETAQLNYDSDLKLYEKNVVSANELQQSLNSLNSAKASVAQTEAQLVSAKNNLSYTEVKSPVDGVAGTIPYRVGALVSSSTQLTSVSDNSVMYVYFSLSENEALDMALEYGSMDKAIENMPDVSLKLNNGAIYEHTGRVASVSGVISQTTGTIQVRAEFPNPDKILMSGANGTVVFPDEYKDVIIIPQEATFTLQDKVFVYKVIDGVTSSQEITVVSKSDGENYVVTSGLEVGDKIIAKGAGLLRAGVPIVEKVEE